MEKWIQGAIKHPGSLRKSLHVKEGQKIPESKLKKAEHSKNKTTAKRARLAETLKSFHHSKEEPMEYSKKRSKMEEELQHDKPKKPKLMNSLKKHFGVEEEDKHEKMEKKYHTPRHESKHNMDKDSRKTLAISIMKKKMKD